jgi:acylpyruvate hydrolase
MRFANFLLGTDVKLGAVVDEWIIDLERAQNYLSEGNDSEKGNSFPGCLSAELMIEISDRDSLFMEASQQTVDFIQESTPFEVESLRSKKVILNFDQAVLEPPIINPGKIICVGLNYPSPGRAEHQPTKFPTLFLKPSSTMTGHRRSVLLPRISEEVFCEGELAVVIGESGKHISIEKALSHVGGYTIANDIGARDFEQRTSQWATGKLADTFCPLGPILVTPDEIPEANKLEIQTQINRKLVQKGNTSQMIFSVPYLISYISSIATLFPGDIILTGSPKSIDNQPTPVVFLNAGDDIMVKIEGIGGLSNHTVQEEN